jgi:hypothetical protein
MNDNKLIFSLVIGVIVLFGLFMILTGEEQDPVTVIVNNDLDQEEFSLPDVTDDIIETPVIEGIADLEAIFVEPVEEIIEEVENLVEPEPVIPTLPSLNNSDPFIKEELAALDGGSPLLRYLVSEELLRKFVVMIENISRGEFPERNLPLLYSQERMTVTELGSEFYLIDEQSYQRFNSLVEVLTNISTETAVDFYQNLQPLLSEAYAELGIRNTDFNDVFMQAIDNLLNARTAPQPQQLIRPNLNYLYADPAIENYSSVEKLLLRLGPENSESLKRRLEFFKRRLELEASLAD